MSDLRRRAGSRLLPLLVVPTLLFVLLTPVLAGPGDRPSAPGRPFADPIPPVTFGLFDAPLAQKTALDTTWTRVTANWASIETALGTYYWDALDAQVLPAVRHGLQVILAVHSSGPGTMCGSPVRFSAPRPDHMFAFRRFIRAMAERYDGDGIADAPGLAGAVHYWQVENQWNTAVFFRGSDNCGSPGFGDEALAQIGIASVHRPPESTGNPRVAAREFLREYRAVYDAAHRADGPAIVGPGNLPTQTVDAALFCDHKTGPYFRVNQLKADGTVASISRYNRAEVCRPGGANRNNIKTWARYWNPAMRSVLSRLAGKVDYLDLAQYGRYSDVQLRNEWVTEQVTAWGYTEAPPLVAWEVAGPDWRVTTPARNVKRAVALDLVKRLSLAFATGTRALTWFHYHQNPGAAVAVRFTSLLDESGKRAPAFYNYRLLVQSVAGASSASLQRVGDGGRGYLITFAFDDGRRVDIAWSERPVRFGLDVGSASVVKITRATGRMRPPATDLPGDGQPVSLQLTTVPVVIYR